MKQPGQLNGKSANLNHVMLQKIFPGVRKYDEIPPKDIIMVIDCDHMVKPEIFNKMGPCMLDEKVAVTLVPQVCNLKCITEVLVLFRLLRVAHISQGFLCDLQIYARYDMHGCCYATTSLYGGWQALQAVTCCQGPV